MATTMTISIDVENASDATTTPDDAYIRRWVSAALSASNAPTDRDYELSIRIVNADESQQLNCQYRGQDKPTNVLSFPSEFPPELNIPLLGDLAICANVVEQEAHQQNKTSTAHWAHMLVHGTLHLLDYDHIDDDDADIMESLETSIITSLGFPAPYKINR
jgi:probable rRNA maturation factor